MKNTFGNNISITLFGESHGEAIGTILDGITPGIKIDMDFINKEMQRRKPTSIGNTSRCEDDEIKILSGVYNGYTEGTPICILIENKNVDSTAYDEIENLPRPSHADFSANAKYHGFEDKRGGGHFSGRLTAPIVAVGAIFKKALLQKGIEISSNIKSIYGIENTEKANEIIKNAKENGDSVGGIVSTSVLGVPIGVGEPFFDSIESELAHAMFSIPAVKGIEFGKGFEITKLLGSQANDEFYISNGKIITKTNNSGGINGGISNGMPITFNIAIKPTPSIAIEQNTVNLKTKTEEKIKISGRHDACLVNRVLPLIENLTAFVLADLLIGRFGTDYLK